LLEFKDYQLTINLTTATKEMTKNELDMTFTELQNFLRTHTADDKERRDTLIEFHRRFSLPFACFAFALVGVPLGIQNHRSGKAAGFAVSIGLILAYYIILTIGKTMGQKGLVLPVIAVWTPDVLFMFLGIYLYRKTAMEKTIPLIEFFRTFAARMRDRKSGGGVS
jgi:lipopolysaccharide export system permease protein